MKFQEPLQAQNRENSHGVFGAPCVLPLLFSERFDALVDLPRSTDESALRIAATVLNVLKPYVHAGATAELEALAGHYET